MSLLIEDKATAVRAWFAAYNAHDVEGICRVAHPDIDIVPSAPIVVAWPGASFHRHEGVRSVISYAFETYPRTRIDSLETRKISGWVLASMTVVLDDRVDPPLTRAAVSLFDIEDGLVRRIHSFRSERQALDAAAANSSLTPREREIFQLLARGSTGPQIAETLFLSPATVRTHVQNGIERLGANTRVQAIALALSRGEITL
jgi:DNA-binding CsgD family transcriptional regulator